MAIDSRFAVNLSLAVVSGLVSYAAVFYLWNFIPLNPLTQWLIDNLAGTNWFKPIISIQDFLVNLVLSLPLATALCLLRPRRLLLFTLAALLPAFVWSFRLPISEGTFLEVMELGFVGGWLVSWLSLPLAVFLLKGRLGGGSPNNKMQQTRDSLENKISPSGRAADLER